MPDIQNVGRELVCRRGVSDGHGCQMTRQNCHGGAVSMVLVRLSVLAVSVLVLTEVQVVRSVDCWTI